MACPVKFFNSTMQGAPVLSNVFGAMTALLDACLVDGFNLKTLTSLTSSSGVATATIAAGHLYQVEQIVLIAGANQSEYNGEARVISVTPTTFTYAITGNPASPATTGSTLTVKAAPLGFEKVFSGTNKRAYRSQNVLSNRPFLRVDDGQDPVWTATYSKFAKVTLAENMIDIDGFTGARAPFDPLAVNKNEVGTGSGSAAYNGWYKWYYAKAQGNQTDTSTPDAYNRGWFLIGDDRGFYLCPESSYGYGKAGYAFTDFESYRTGDAYRSILIATDNYQPATGYAGYNGENPNLAATNNWTGKIMMRDHTQIGLPTRGSFMTLTPGGLAQIYSGYSTGIAWPNPCDYSMILQPVYLQQEAGGLRGKMPGLMFVLNNSSPLYDYVIVSGVTGYPARKFIVVGLQRDYSGVLYRVMFDITGPWW